MKEVITALSNDDKYIELSCYLDDNNFISSRELRDIIIDKKMSGCIKVLHISHDIDDEDIRNRCLDFVLRCLEGPRNKIKIFYYCGSYPMTLADANRFATSILSNNNFKLLGFVDLANGSFSNKETFECVFNAVLDSGLKRFGICGPYKNTIGRTCNAGRFNLATNTTLKHLDMHFRDVTNMIDDAEVIQLAKILEVNTRLKNIYITGVKFSKLGEKYLLESLRYNTTLQSLEIEYPKKNKEKELSILQSQN